MWNLGWTNEKTEIRDFNGYLIGERRMLSIEINEVSGLEDLSRLGFWRMHEYILCGINKNIPNVANTIFCKIMLDYSKSPAIKLKEGVLEGVTTDGCSKEGVLEGVTTDGCSKEGVLEGVTTDGCSKEGVLNGVTADVCSKEGVLEGVSADGCSKEGVLEGVTTDGCSKEGVLENSGEVEIDEEWMNSILLDISDFDCTIDDFTTNLGKRKLQDEIPNVMSKRLCY
ncbi:hypothetical protein POM88_010171 [Heracleum sosnowskyi]|uniref:Uncharacterized protein n=1 Tax=Heracleum sosnowskyi TaxID=360622 RepID=A0AAD8NAB9_9APIA|nr:hypothetical protein POM88_010171 [Heracleum sosnowskyi]